MNVHSYDSLYENMKNYMSSNQKKVTDYNEGSIISTIFEAVARSLERAYIDVRNGYSNNLKQIPYELFNFKKKEGAYSTGSVTFSRATPINKKTIIPIGTIISDGEHKFRTTGMGEIKIGDKDSNDVPVTAEETGLNNNVDANTITVIESILSDDIVAVNNKNRTTGGTDTETDVQLEERFKQFINGLQGTNIYGFKSSILSIKGIRSVAIVEHHPAKQNIYNATVYVDDGTGILTPELKQSVEDTINGKDNSVYPGCRAAGIQVLVASAEPVNVKLSVKVLVYRTDEETARADVKDAMVEEINGLTIGKDIEIFKLINRLSQIGYVKNVTKINIIHGEEVQPTDFEILENQIARITADAIEVEVGQYEVK